METIIAEIKAKIGDLSLYSSYDKKNRPFGCPMKRMMRPELQVLTNEEINIAFRMGLIGNNNRVGTIVPNSKM